MKLEGGRWICGVCQDGSCAGCQQRAKIAALSEPEINRLDPWESAVMVPYKGHFKNPDKQVDAALIIAFDAESDHHVEVVEHGGKPHKYSVSDLLCFTFAAWGRDGTVKVDRGSVSKLLFVCF